MVSKGSELIMLRIVVQGYVDAINVATGLTPPRLPPHSRPRVEAAPAAQPRASLSLGRHLFAWGKTWLLRVSTVRAADAAGPPDAESRPVDPAARSRVALFLATDH